MTNQRQATVSTILAVLEERGVNYELNGETSISEVLNADDKTKIRDILFTQFKNKSVQYKESFQAKVDDDAELKKYVSGLLNNWMRKAPEFNNDTKHEAKNPGSRAGSTDPQVKEMRKLLSVTADAEAKVAIQSAIDTKLAEIKASKQVVEINIDLLPEHLRDLIK